jgi:hypothetical protein
MSSFTNTITITVATPDEENQLGQIQQEHNVLLDEYTAEELQIPPLERCATVETPFTEDPESGEIKDLSGNVVAVLEPNISQEDRMKVYAELLQQYYRDE